jgi:hypothetical protein
MPLFAVVGFDIADGAASLRERHREAHRAYFRAKADSARFAGAFYGVDGRQCGSFLLFEAESAEALLAWFCNEPFYKSGLYREFHVLDFRVALNRFAAGGWDPDFPASISPRAPD